MNIIILADGVSKPEHMGNDRHFLLFDGEPLLLRTARQFRELGHVKVIAPPEYGERLPGVWVTQSPRRNLFFAADMIDKGIYQMGPQENLIVFGDVWFSDEAIEIIRKADHSTWRVFGRSEASRFMGSGYAEYFAISLHWRQQDKAMKALEAAANYHMADQWYRCTPWEWYFEMEGLPYYIPNPARVKVGPHWTEIHDRTDDFDFPHDVKRWHGKP